MSIDLKNKSTLLVILALVFAVCAGYYFGFDHGFERAQDASIDSFEGCAAAGYPIMESYPEQCRTKDGRNFTRIITGTDGYECNADARICPDGTSVGRSGPNCEFICPAE